MDRLYIGSRRGVGREYLGIIWYDYCQGSSYQKVQLGNALIEKCYFYFLKIMCKIDRVLNLIDPIIEQLSILGTFGHETNITQTLSNLKKMYW